MPLPSKFRRPKVVVALIETFGFSPLLASITALFLTTLGAAAILWVFLSAPPRTISIITGPPGSTFQRYAENYAEALAKHGVTLKILPSAGSLDNLRRLAAAGSGVDLAFVQGGLVGDKPPPGIVSLGSVSYQPLWIFYRDPSRVALLSQFAGRRIGIGTADSGVATLAKSLLEANGITGAPSTLVPQESDAASKDFLAGKLDVIFLMGDSASIDTLRALLHADGVQLYSFTQADAYVRRRGFTYLNKVVLPQGSIDFGRNLPAQDVVLVGPAVELVARRGLNSAVSDLLLKVAQDFHGRPTLLSRRGEFPAPLEREYPISDDARRYYKSGQSLTYNLVTSFWLANLINRLLVAIVPIFLVLIPAIRFLPVVYRWSVQLRIYRCYRPLLRLERDAETPLTPGRTEELLARLDQIEADVNGLKVPASFASQFYDLRNHIAFVRHRLQAARGAGS